MGRGEGEASDNKSNIWKGKFTCRDKIGVHLSVCIR